MSLWKRLRQYRRRAQFEAGLEEEMRFHREMAGPAAFGSTALALEDSRAVWGFAWLESLLRDFRYALRGFGKSPGFVLAVVGTIGAALGLNTTLFTVFNAYVLRPFSVLDPWALYHFSWYGKNGQPHRFTWEQYQELAARQTLFTDVLATETLPADVEGRTLYGHLVSGNYFTMLAAGMAAGRPLLPRDAAAPGTGAVMVLSYDVWKNQFGADPNMVGRTVHLRGHAFEVVGIAGPAFAGVDSFPNGYWIPLSMHAVVQDLRELAAVPQSESLDLIGRLHPGLRPEVAKTALLAWSGGFAGSLAREQRPVGFEIDSTATMVPLTHDTILSFLPLFIAFGLVLLIACANVSNMMLARGLSRQREIGIRISLGAGRTRLVRQLLAESALLAVPAAALGMAVSVASIEAARRLLFATIPPDFAFVLMMPSLTPDLPVFGFILLAAMLAILVFGLAPALETTRSRLVEANRGDFSSDYRPARLRSFLLVTQVAVCSLLLIATAIVLRSQHRVTALNIGLDLHGVWDIRMAAKYQPAAAERLAATPGVEAVAEAWHAPLHGIDRPMALVPSGGRAKISINYNLVSPEFFPVFRVPILRGRAFTAVESEADAPVAVVSETAARRLWPGADAIGQSVSLPRVDGNASPERIPAFTEARVIGVARDALTGNVASRERPTSMIYFPTSRRARNNDSVLVRFSDTSQVRRRLVAALDGIAPSLYDLMTPMDGMLAVQFYPFQVTFWVAGFLGALALVMTVSGIYGVLSYLVSQRTKEIGIRMALGAGTGDVVRMVVRQSARLALVGVVIGVALALAIAPVFAHQIEAIRPYDWLAYGAAVAIVMAAAVSASFAPTRRALRADPVAALRCD